MLRKINLAMSALLLLTLLPGPAHASHIELTAKGAQPGSAILELATDVLVTMTPIPFRLIVKDAKGEPVVGAKVSCEMTMPSMSMPENRPKVTERDGFYDGELMFTCAQGAWRISCDVVRRGLPKQSLTFDIDQVRMR